MPPIAGVADLYLLRKKFPGVPVIVLTALVSEEFENRLHPVGGEVPGETAQYGSIVAAIEKAVVCASKGWITPVQ